LNYQLYRFNQDTGLPYRAKIQTQTIVKSENLIAIPQKSSWPDIIHPLCSPKIKKPPLVSVVTPSYNCGRYIRDCIESVLAQDYFRVEHIIQDGCSTDKTKKILAEYQQHTYYKDRLRIFIEPDRGQSDGLNKAIQKAKGDIILVLNADDMITPSACSWAVENMTKYPQIAVIYGDEYIIDEKGKITNIYQGHEYEFEKLLCVELVPPTQAAFIRRSHFEKVGFHADANLDTCPDYEMWVRIGLKFPMKHVFGVVTKYRHHKIPQVDSRQTRTTSRFVTAKKEVMDRVFDNRKTPERIKKLRHRAYGGLYAWAATTALEMKEYNLAVSYLTKILKYNPNWDNLKRILTIIKNSPFFFIFGRRLTIAEKHAEKATTALKRNHYTQAAQYLVKAFWLKPSFNNLKRIFLIWKDSPLFFIRAVFKF
jgi:glycosyltransferase involved in cell wall biosynthesis